ncbi:MAG: hypothetical protein R2726_03450 [Acidimicrobiales bacterium]
MTPPADDVTPDFPGGGRRRARAARGRCGGPGCSPTRLGDRLRPDGFTDDEIDAWTRAYFESSFGGQGEGDVDGLVAFIEAEQAAGRDRGR